MAVLIDYFHLRRTSGNALRDNNQAFVLCVVRLHLNCFALYIRINHFVT